MKTRAKPQIRLPRREFLKRGGMGVLGTIIAASTFGGFRGVQRASAETVMANLKTLKMGEFNPNYATQWSYRLAMALGYMKEVGIDDFEVILSENRNQKLVMQYKGIAAGTAETGTSATIGVEKADGSAATQLSFNKGLVYEGLTVAPTAPK